MIAFILLLLTSYIITKYKSHDFSVFVAWFILITWFCSLYSTIAGIFNFLGGL